MAGKYVPPHFGPQSHMTRRDQINLQNNHLKRNIYFRCNVYPLINDWVRFSHKTTYSLGQKHSQVKPPNCRG